ncbi:MAG: FeoC-like transcriptional regulator [Anaerolineae bacterium]|nr:FeoC-like transcriptional regulator [Anaerolineae bacterium]
MTSLRDVLAVFESSPAPLSVEAAARHLTVERGILESMVNFWVQKGKLRPVNCASCGLNGSCPILARMPLMYEVVRELPEARLCKA